MEKTTESFAGVQIQRCKKTHQQGKQCLASTYSYVFQKLSERSFFSNFKSTPLPVAREIPSIIVLGGSISHLTGQYLS